MFGVKNKNVVDNDKTIQPWSETWFSPLEILLDKSTSSAKFHEWGEKMEG